jgi:hypothetical protein
MNPAALRRALLRLVRERPIIGDSMEDGLYPSAEGRLE